VDFAWPIESVLTTDAEGVVTIERYSTNFNTTNLFKAEFSEATNAINKEIRVIRGMDGYYYITAPGFKNVYLLYAKDGELIVEDRFLITEDGLTGPIFNQQKPDIELRDGDTVYLINSNGLKEGEK
jgi:hypothetical protein